MAKAKVAKKKAPKRKKAAPRKAAAKKPLRYCLGKCARCGGGCCYNKGHSGAHDCGTH